LNSRKIGGLFGAFFAAVVAGYFLFSCKLSLGALDLGLLVSEFRFWLFVFAGVAMLACLAVAFSGDKPQTAVAVEVAPVSASGSCSVSSVEADSGLGGSKAGFVILQPGTRILSVTDGAIELPEGGFLYPPKPVQPLNEPVMPVVQTAVVAVKERRFFKPVQVEVQKR
jgi:hypothetical protein